MKYRRIKVFLGGYVNFLNAQNINCRALSEHLDKDRFEVWTMLFWYQNAKDFRRVPGVHYLKSRRPVRFLGWIPYFIGILRCDVAYLPKGEYEQLCHFMARWSGCKLFTTLEGVLAGTNLSKVNNQATYINHFRRFEPRLYGITYFMADHACRVHGLHFASRILYLGVEYSQFATKRQHGGKGLQNVVFIGNNIMYKGIEDFLSVAVRFPDINFHCVGGNQMKDGLLETYILDHDLHNVKYHGLLDHSRLAALLSDMDLMYFPSRSEGFPKVLLEAACAGVPSICYGDYGAAEWITTGQDGFVVADVDEAIAVISNLYNHPEQLIPLANNAVMLGRRFDWQCQVKVWEDEIVKL